MGNVLDPSKQQQVVALGRLGWSLRRIEQATGVRRETISGYLRAAGVAGARPRASAGGCAGRAERSDGKAGHFVGGGVHRLRAVAGAERECLRGRTVS